VHHRSPTVMYPLSLHDALPIFGMVEHPVVVDWVLSGGLFGDGEGGVESLGEVFAIVAGQDLVARGPQHMTAHAGASDRLDVVARSEEHTSELQSLAYLVCRLLL